MRRRVFFFPPFEAGSLLFPLFSTSFCFPSANEVTIQTPVPVPKPPPNAGISPFLLYFFFLFFVGACGGQVAPPPLPPSFLLSWESSGGPVPGGLFFYFFFFSLCAQTAGAIWRFFSSLIFDAAQGAVDFLLPPDRGVAGLVAGRFTFFFVQKAARLTRSFYKPGNNPRFGLSFHRAGVVALTLPPCWSPVLLGVGWSPFRSDLWNIRGVASSFSYNGKTVFAFLVSPVSFFDNIVPQFSGGRMVGCGSWEAPFFFFFLSSPSLSPF